MSQFPGSPTIPNINVFGGYLGGFLGWDSGWAPLNIAQQTELVSPEKPVETEEAVLRPDTYYSYLGGRPGYFPGFDKAPPPSIAVYWMMRRYAIIRLATAVTVGPLLAGIQQIEISDPDMKDDENLKKLQELATHDVLPAVQSALPAAFECLNFGWWLQEVIWDEREDRVYPRRIKSILPGEATIYRDAFHDFAGFKIANEYRDSRYALLNVHNPYVHPIFGESRLDWCREEWWRIRQSELNADQSERKASGIQMAIGYPVGSQLRDANNNIISPAQYGQTLINAATQGQCIAFPTMNFSQEAIQSNPELAKIPAVSIQQLNWGDIGPAIRAHLDRISDLDKKIMQALQRPAREAMESEHGSRADSQSHGQVGITDSELVGNLILGQASAQVLDRWGVTNFPGYEPGCLVIRQAPLSDPQQQFLQTIAQGLATGTTPDPEFVSQIDRRSLGERVELPMVSEDEAAQKLAEQKQETQQEQSAKMDAAKTKVEPKMNGNGKPKRLPLSAEQATEILHEGGYLTMADERMNGRLHE